eukprot:gene5272-6110_t
MTSRGSNTRGRGGRGAATSRGGRGGATNPWTARGGAAPRGGARGGRGRGGVGSKNNDSLSSRDRYANGDQSNSADNEIQLKQSEFLSDLQHRAFDSMDANQLKELKLKLINIVSASLIKEPRFNNVTPALENIVTAAYRISCYDGEFVLKLALYTRDELGIRTVANYLVCLAAVLAPCQPYLKKYFKESIKLPSDWLELPGIVAKLTDSQSIPKSLRNVMVEKFPDFDAYQLGKYNTEGKIKRRRKKLKALIKKNPEEKETLTKEFEANRTASLKQLIRVLHISQPNNNIMCILGKKYPSSHDEFVKLRLPGEYEGERAGKRMKLPIPETWETLLSEKGNKASTWEELMDHNKLPFMAMLRNLRNILICGVQPRHHNWIINKLTNERTIANSKQFPLRFLAAFDAIPKDIEQLKTWAADKSIKIAYHPGAALLDQYRSALDTSVKLATTLNVKPIRGTTLVFVYVSGGAGNCNSNSAGKYSLLESALLLGLMCKFVSESCELVLVGESPSGVPLVLPVVGQLLQDESILANMRSLKETIAGNFKSTEEDTRDAKFPTDYIMKMILEKRRIDNLLILNHTTIVMETESHRRNILTKYRQELNNDMLYVAINLSGHGAVRHDASAHPNDVQISGFSDSILKFIAERGGADQQLLYIERIDEIKKLHAKIPVSAPTTTLAAPPAPVSEASQTGVPSATLKPWRTARIFISSTFLDMHGERDLIVKYVVPELRERAAARRIHVTEVDLRWGITEDEAARNRSVELCLDEVDRCRPFFVGLLGQRYGWIPGAAAVQKMPDEPRYDWARDLVQRGRSITELEMTHALNNEGADPTKTLFYLRDSSQLLREVPREHRSHFEGEDRESAAKLERLKQMIRENAPYKTYQANFQGLVDGRPAAGGLDDLHVAMVEDLWERISNEFPEEPTVGALDAAVQETSAQRRFADLKTTKFVGRKDDIGCLFKFVEVARPYSTGKVAKLNVSANKSNILLLTGKPGAGKTALLAHFVFAAHAKHLVDNAHKLKSGLPSLVISHFVDASVASRDVSLMLRRIATEIITSTGLNETIPDDYAQLKLFVPVLLKKASLKAKVILVIDGIDSLSPAHAALSLDWLPNVAPVKIIVSAADGDHTISILRRRKTQPLELAIDALESSDSSQLVQSTLADFRKKLDDSPANNQLRSLLTKADATLPLYIVLACEELRLFGVHEGLTDKIKSLAPTLPRLFDDILTRLESDHTRTLVSTALGAISCSRSGLTESDLVVILARNDQEAALPSFIWARLLRGLAPLLIVRPDRTFAFFHNSLHQAVDRRYLAQSDAQIRIHKTLATHYSALADPTATATFTGSPIAISELPYHLARSRNIVALESTLCNLAFVERKCSLGMTHALIGDYVEALGDDLLDDSPAPSSLSSAKLKIRAMNDHIRDFWRLVTSSSHILAASPSLLMQQAANQPASSFASKVARAAASSKTTSWVEWSNKPEGRDACKQTLTGFNAGASSVAYSPNGRLLAVASKDCSIRILNATNGAEIFSLEGHTNSVASLAFSPDSKLLASASWDNSAALWDVVVGTKVASLNGHSRAVNCVRFSPDGTLLATAGWDSTSIVWTVADRSQFRTFRGHSKPVNHVAWSSAGDRLATSSWDGSICLWDTAESSSSRGRITPVARLLVPSLSQGSIKAAEFSPNTKQMVATMMDGSIFLFDIGSSRLVSTIGRHTKSANSITFSEDGAHFATSSDDATVRLWTPSLGREIGSMQLAEGWANCLVHSPSRGLLAAGCSDCIVRVYDASVNGSPRELFRLAGHTRAILSVTFSPDGSLIASTSEDRTIMVWSVDRRVLAYKIDNAHTDTINCVAFSPDGQRILSASDDFSCKLWNAQGKEVARLSGNTNTVKHATYSPNGKYIATVSRDCTITVYLAASNKFLAKMSGHTDWINFVAFSPDSKRLVSGGWDFNLKIWSMNSRNELRTLRGHTGSIEKGFFTPDGRYIISCSFDGTIKVWDPEFGSEITSLSHASRISDVAHDGDESNYRIFSASDDGIVKVWLPVVGQCLATLSGHAGSVRSSVFLPSGRSDSSSSFGSFGSSQQAATFRKTLASASDDGTVRVWDFSEQTALTTPHTAGVNALSISFDGKYMASVADDRVVNIWDVKTTKVIKSITVDSPATSCSFTKGGNLVVGKQNGELIVYDPTFGPSPSLYQAHGSQITCVSPLSFDNSYVTGGWDRVLNLWNVEKRVVVKLSTTSDWIECVAFARDGSLIAAAGRQNAIYLVRPNMESSVYTLSFDCQYITSLAFSPDSLELAIGTFEGNVEIMDTESRTFTSVITAQKDAITGLHYLDNHRLLSASKDRSLIVYNTETEEVENQFVHNAPITALDCRNNTITTGDSNGNVYFLNYHDKKS